MKQEEDLHSIILMVTVAQCNVCMIGSMSYGTRALDHFGRITQPKVLTRDNAWRKRYDWRSREERCNDQHYVYNHLTEERRNITEQQYDNEQTITDDGRLAI